MASASATRFLFLAFLISSAALFTICRASEDPEVEDQSHFTYGKLEQNGPHKWGQLDPEWSVCNAGKLQSPIDMSNKRVQVKTNQDLQFLYRPALANVTNRGHDIAVHFEGNAGGIRINGTDYKALQVHWHTPSEHTVGGTRYDMEAHIVHKSADSVIAVVGILFKIGCPDRFLGKILHHIKAVTDKVETGKDLGMISPKEIRFNGKQYYRYLGSLTTPPCTEGVIWTVVKKVRTVSLEQLHALREAVKDGYETNARPVQM